MDCLTNPWRRALCVLVVAGIALVSGPARAATFDLVAEEMTRTMADGNMVPMWGFRLSTDTVVSVPGPVLDIPPGDATLTVNLTNNLPVPISIVIPGLPAQMTPIWDDGSTGDRTSPQQRVFSFTHVVQPGATGTYEWTGIQPGTYLYHSGTHPAVQVPMGLYGAVRHDAAAGVAYGAPGLPEYAPYDEDAVLLYSEVDPDLHAAVDGGTYGTVDYPSTTGYRPRYFLINGQEATVAPALGVDVQDRVLLRLINAGSRSIVPTLTRGTMTLLAEDGNRAPFGREAYSVLLPASQTRDVLYEPAEDATVTLFDRRGSALLAQIDADAVAGAPVAVDDVGIPEYVVSEDGTLMIPAPGVLANDSAGATAVLDSGPPVADPDAVPPQFQLLADGSFSYTPPPDYNGTAVFTYHATAGGLDSNVALVAITVTPANDAPVAASDTYVAIEGQTLVTMAPGVLANDTDVDLDGLTAQLVLGVTGGTLSLSPDGSFEYTPDPGTAGDSFTYQAWDGTAASNIATVTIAVVAPPNDPPVAVDDFATTQKNTPVIINLVANDTDPQNNIDPASVMWTAPTRGGTVVSGTVVGGAPGTVLFTPKNNFKGTDTFTYVVSDALGLTSEPATVRVNVLK